ncbi:hypothetical protein J3458_011739 [Metarhizium acridum]|uniref:uncharacterized protein n=1 Tax=Metarhizium acridum TaxID=92637 RepID=UPI001C6AA24D|nr:hypothetical protein J3458_011739 [Metarhizium acridum]
MSCGRFLAFFITTLGVKRTDYATYISRRSSVDQTELSLSLARDEELLVYVSADIQASPNRSWLWSFQDRDAASPKTRMGSQSHPGTSENVLFSSEQRTGLNEEERRDWVGWTILESMARNMGSVNVPYPPPLPPPQVKSESPIANVELPRLSETSRYSVGHRGDASPPGPKRGAERISIANII